MWRIKPQFCFAIESIGEDGNRRIAHQGLWSPTSVLQSSNMAGEGVQMGQMVQVMISDESMIDLIKRCDLKP
jgi:hypothetical protein